jgi:hypothetical protein
VLDFRVFIVTVFMSFVLIAVAIIELLCMFGVFQGIADMRQYKLVVFYTCSEALPSVLIAFYLSTGITSDDSPGGHYKAVNQLPLAKGKESDSEDSEFGSFNPNLHAHDNRRSGSFSNQSKSNNLSKTAIELKKPLFPLNQMKFAETASDSFMMQKWDAQVQPREGTLMSDSGQSEESHSSGSESNY